MGETHLSGGLLVPALVIAVVAFILFVRVEKKAQDPIISLSLFKNRTFVVQNAVAALVMVS